MATPDTTPVPRGGDRSGHCPLCGTWRKVLVRDHIHPKHLGGTEDSSNLQYICANCHQDKTEAELKARVITDQERENRRNAQLGKVGHPMSPETKAKLLATHVGKPLSLETRYKISAAKSKSGSLGRRMRRSVYGQA